MPCPGPERAHECDNVACRHGGCQGRQPQRLLARHRGSITLAWIAAALALFAAAAAHAGPPSDPVHRPCFRPGAQSCIALIVDEIERAHGTAHVEVYNWTAAPTADALIEAHRYGVDVRIVIDTITPTQRGNQVDRAHAAGIPIFVDCHRKIHHDKVLIVDGQTVGTGSFNWTDDAERFNAENLLFIEHVPDLAAAYEADFAAQVARSEPYDPMLVCGHPRQPTAEH